MIRCLLGCAVVVAGLGPVAAMGAGETIVLKPLHKVAPAMYLEFREDLQSTAQGTTTKDKVRDMRWLRYVGALEEGLAGGKVKYTWDRFAWAVETSFQSFLFDSDFSQDAEGPGARYGSFFRPIVGQSVTFDFDADGKLTRIENLDRVRGHVHAAMQEKAAKDAGNADATAKDSAVRDAEDIWKSLEVQITEPVLTEYWYSTRNVLYPNKAVKAGETWENEIRQKTPVLTLLYKYSIKLDRIEKREGGRLAYLSFSGTVEQTPKEHAASRPERQTVNDMSGTISGNAVYDEGRGEFLTQSREIVLDFNNAQSGVGADRHHQVMKQSYKLFTAAERAADKAKHQEEERAAAARAASRAASQPGIGATALPGAPVTSQPAGGKTGP